MPVTQHVHYYQPFLRACVRFLGIGCLVYLATLFVDGAFTSRDLVRAFVVFTISGMICYHWRHLLTAGIGVTDRALHWRIPVRGSRSLSFKEVRRVTVTEEYAAFSDGKTMLTIYARELTVCFRLSHLENTTAFLEDLEARLSGYPARVMYPDGEGSPASGLREGF